MDETASIIKWKFGKASAHFFVNALSQYLNVFSGILMTRDDLNVWLGFFSTGGSGTTDRTC